MTGLLLKLKSKNGQHVINNIEDDTTIGKLKAIIENLTKIPAQKINILIGYPPKPLDLSKESDVLSAFGIKSGEILIVDEKTQSTEGVNRDGKSELPSKLFVENEDAKLALRLQEEENKVAATGVTDSFNSENGGDFIGILLKKVVPADNSCLFTSIGFCLNGTVNTDCGFFMRKIIAEHVAADKETYSEGILGRPNLEYCEWIQRSDSWGGAIEVSILSNFYGMEFDVVDITNSLINRFGEDMNYGMRAFLLFDGIHYDPLYLESTTGGTPKTVFPMEAENVMQQAEQIAKEAKSSRQFTDVNKFTLRCIQCDVMLTGQVEAQQHARLTGHANFGEV